MKGLNRFLILFSMANYNVIFKMETDININLIRFFALFRMTVKCPSAHSKGFYAFFKLESFFWNYYSILGDIL